MILRRVPGSTGGETFETAQIYLPGRHYAAAIDGIRHTRVVARTDERRPGAWEELTRAEWAIDEAKRRWGQVGFPDVVLRGRPGYMEAVAASLRHTMRQGCFGHLVEVDMTREGYANYAQDPAEHPAAYHANISDPSLEGLALLPVNVPRLAWDGVRAHCLPSSR